MHAISMFKSYWTHKFGICSANLDLIFSCPILDEEEIYFQPARANLNKQI